MKSTNLKYVPLGDVVDIVGGGTPSKRNQEYYGGNIPWATVRDMHSDILSRTEHSLTPKGLDESSSKLVPAGEVVIATRVGLGKVCLLLQDTAINQDLRGLVPKKTAAIDRKFLFYWYKSVSKQVVDAGTGATVQGVKLPFVKGLAFPKLDLSEQRRIVEVLDKAFEGLARARTNAETNLANARELFESLRFVMLSEQAEGWETHPLADCFRLKSGDNLTAKQMVPGPFPVYGGNGIAGTHDVSNLSGDNVIVGRVGALCGNARYIDHDIWLTDNAFKVVNCYFDFDHRFLAYLLNFKNLRSLARQAAQPVISNSSLADLELTFPASVELQAKLASKLSDAESDLEDIKKKYEAKIQDIDDLRQSLLQKAFAGELT